MTIKLPDFSQANILVVGDVMLDRYWYGDTSRVSPEAPVPVVKVQQTEDRPGGAANVALNVCALGAKATLLGVVGEDEAASILKAQLEGAKVRCSFISKNDIPTVTKLRVISRHQQLVRLDFEKTNSLASDVMVQKFKESLEGIDVVIFSDYKKGTLSQVSELINIAKQVKIPSFVDPKNVDLGVYQNATVVTPNFKEFQAAAGECHSEEEIVTKGKALLTKHHLENLLVTRGERGMTLLTHDKPEVHLPTRAREVFDVTGAGDTVIATLATAYAAGVDLTQAMSLANAAAGVAVSKLGAATVSAAELRRALHSEQGEPGGVMSEEQLMLAVEDARAHGETIVMTNGCFDILHAGHVHYLEQAKALGDHLIVAVNSDDSVRKLKGKGRPLNTLEKRMRVLSGLAAVDWVVPFSEDTPARLIANVLPDVLTKGGDYKVEDIAGSDCVLKNGGRVEILDFVEGLSTSNLLNQINHEIREERE